MEKCKKILRFFASMKFAIILLIVVAIACMVGSLVPQGEQFELHRADYSERTAALIVGLQLDDVFHSVWFIVLTALLCVNLLFCNLSRLKSLIARTKEAAVPEQATAGVPDVSAQVEDPEAVLRRMRYFRPTKLTLNGHEALFAYRNRIGYWGAWICHLGIVLIVLGYALGQMTLYSSYVYGTPGQTRAIENRPYEVTIDDFQTERNETGFVEQYVATLTVRNTETGETQSGTASVNHPAVLGGMKFYQNSTGPATRVTISENGVPFDTTSLCVGEELTVSFLPGLSLYLNAYEPDHNGNGPAYHVLFFYNGQHISTESNYIAPGGSIELSPYTITLSAPVEYTMLRVKKDSFAWLVGVGALLTTIGLFFALYLVPETVWAVRDEDGVWTLHGKSRKLAPLFEEQFDRAVTGKRRKEETV